MKKVVVNTNCIGLVFKNGELIRVLNSGIYWMLPWADVKIFDMSKQFPIDINAEVLSLDKDFAAKTILINVEMCIRDRCVWVLLEDLRDCICSAFRYRYYYFRILSSVLERFITHGQSSIMGLYISESFGLPFVSPAQSLSLIHI